MSTSEWTKLSLVIDFISDRSCALEIAQAQISASTTSHTDHHLVEHDACFAYSVGKVPHTLAYTHTLPTL